MRRSVPARHLTPLLCLLVAGVPAVAPGQSPDGTRGVSQLATPPPAGRIPPYTRRARPGPDHAPPVLQRLPAAWSASDSVERRRTVAELRESNSYYITLAVWYVSVQAQDLDGAATIARLLTRDNLVPSARGFGHIVLAYLAVARGRPSEAERELAAAERFLPVDAAEARANLLLVPFVPATPAQLRAARRRLAPPAADTLLPLYEPHGFSTVHEGQHALIQSYLRGGLDARLGEYAAARRQVARLEAVAADSTQEPKVRALARDLALGLHARIGRNSGRDDDALDALERMELDAPVELAWVSPFYARIHERWLRAELLAEHGRSGDAIEWYRTLVANAPYDLVYLAPTLLREAELLEQLGQVGAAARHYRRVIELWRDCEPALRPIVTEAERRLANLDAGAVAS